MPVVSICGRLRRSSYALGRHEVAAWWWSSLRQHCPRAAAAVVVPDGFWLVADTEPARLFADVTRSAQALTARLGERRPVWRPISSPLTAVSGAQARRWVRAALQWPRALRLCSDPVGWRWSTARDLTESVCDPWVEPGWGLAAALGEPQPGTHASAVGAAPSRPRDRHEDRRLSQRVGWRGGPTLAQPIGDRQCWHGVGPAVSLPSLPLGRVPLRLLIEAAAEATRARPDAITRPGATRNVFLWLADAHGWEARALAEATGASLARVAAVQAQPNLRWLDAAWRCLIDPRIGRLGATALRTERAGAGCYRG